MKRYLLIALYLFMFSNVARAEMVSPSKMTVSEYYSLYNNAVYGNTDSLSTQELYNYFSMTGYLMGIRDITSVKYNISNAKETYDCINRPLKVWIPLVFDAYKLNKIKGDEPFYTCFFMIMEEVCNTDLFGISELENNKTTKPIPMPSSSYKVSEVTDGDTVKIIKNDEEIKVRLVDIDCFETSANPRGKWQAEHYNKSINEVINLGNQSKEILQDFVNQQADGKVVLVDRGKDKYKRTLGVLYIDGVNVNDYMLQYGKCEKYMPRKPLQSLM